MQPTASNLLDEAQELRDRAAGREVEAVLQLGSLNGRGQGARRETAEYRVPGPDGILKLSIHE